MKVLVNKCVNKFKLKFDPHVVLPMQITEVTNG